MRGWFQPLLNRLDKGGPFVLHLSLGLIVWHILPFLPLPNSDKFLTVLAEA